MWYAVFSEVLDWSYRGLYIQKHGVSIQVVNEAFADPSRVVLDPDPASISGRTQRVIGWKLSATEVVTVIVLPADGEVCGVNSWFSNPRDARIYWEAGNDENR